MFRDPEASAASVKRLAQLGVRVKIVTGDNACRRVRLGSLGCRPTGATGDDLDGMTTGPARSTVSIFAA